MATQVVRYRRAGAVGWGVVEGDRVAPISGEYATTREFMREGAERARAMRGAGPEAFALADAEVLCPITPDRQFLCQAINYFSHMKESGFDPAQNPFNIFFTKAPSCLAPATTDIVCPKHVEFLDYEAEIGLVFSRDVSAPVNVTAANLHEYVGALVVVNDVSARDIQIPELQFYKGKSYRTFGPTGPYLTLVDAVDLARFDALRLRLTVNGEVRQNALASDMVHKPAPTLTELSGLQDWQAGDLLATGTPGGCALQAPAAPLRMLAQVMPALPRQRLIRRASRSNPRKLKAGDVIETRICTDDGKLDLGVQRNRVVPAS
jgi:2-keto-4-pentenoate hydratase/2-oxohepta-3-ene-1,7-dioic acid hydratase in catechol pathway